MSSVTSHGANDEGCDSGHAICSSETSSSMGETFDSVGLASSPAKYSEHTIINSSPPSISHDPSEHRTLSPLTLEQVHNGIFSSKDQMEELVFSDPVAGHQETNGDVKNNKACVIMPDGLASRRVVTHTERVSHPYPRMALGSSDSCPARLSSMVDDGLHYKNEHSSEVPQELYEQNPSNDLQSRTSELSHHFTPGGPTALKHVPLLPSAMEDSVTEQVIQSELSAAESTSTPPPIFPPRADRIGQEVSAENAQAFKLPDACVFVANLPHEKLDTELNTELATVFTPFGECWVKVRRDRRNMPFAFVQYSTSDQAQSAMRFGAHMIFGRLCRVELAQAHRTILIARKDGQHLQEEEIRRLLAGAGFIETITQPTNVELTIYRQPPGLYVKFAYWKDAQDALQQHRLNGTYQFSAHRQPVLNGRHFRHHFRRNPPLPPAANPDIDDDCALYIGLFPQTVTLPDIEAVFHRYGPIKHAAINTNHTTTAFCNSHAIVIFFYPEVARTALRGEIGQLRLRNGMHVKVEYAWKCRTFSTAKHERNMARSSMRPRQAVNPHFQLRPTEPDPFFQEVPCVGPFVCQMPSLSRRRFAPHPNQYFGFYPQGNGQPILDPYTPTRRGRTQGHWTDSLTLEAGTY